MIDTVGAVSSLNDSEYTVFGEVYVPDYLSFLEPAVLAPQPSHDSGPISILVVVAESPNLVAPLSEAVLSVLGIADVSSVKVTTSETLAQLRAVVKGELGSFGRGLVFIVFVISAALTGAILFGLVMMRRKDFGRRRALGATQSLIVLLLMGQTALLSLVGAILGTATALVVVAIGEDPLPGADFVVAIGVLAVVISTLASVFPAVAAARRDPIHELRVP
ncbi:ABC transporter permease [Salinibacterium hongtaonis]|uniref:ABC transporter permease n=1 Tax=Homoserinimonas hongtaonis TaxID=2079791 RepID=UPI001F540A09|nr:FtsX-like permease family protein [Salinibacterium hongtaonis]